MNIIQTHKDYASLYNAELRKISELSLESKDTSLFLQIQTLLGNKEKEVEYFIRHNMAQELSLFVRNNRFGPEEHGLLHKVLGFFETQNNSRAAWEVLLKLKNKKLMIKCAIQNQNFVDALKLLKESKKYLNCPELTLPLAEYLVYKHKLREAYDLYRKVNQQFKFEGIMKSYTKLHFLRKNYNRLTDAFRFLYKIYHKSFYFNFLQFFKLFDHVDSEIAKIKEVKNQINNALWKKTYQEYLTKESFSANGTSHSRVLVLRTQVLFLSSFKQITESQIFKSINNDLKDFSGFLDSLDFDKNCVKNVNSEPQDKENFEYNLGSKLKFKRTFNKNNKTNLKKCFLCNIKAPMKTKLSSDPKCQNCKVNVLNCKLSGLPIPVVKFSINKEDGKTTLFYFLRKKILINRKEHIINIIKNLKRIFRINQSPTCFSFQYSE
jgi:hypothetical protein